MSTSRMHPSRPLWLRLASTACPPQDRPWLMALFAESSAIRSPIGRFGWLLGAAVLVTGANVRRGLGLLRHHPVLAIAVSLVLATLLALPSLLGYEVLLGEDDHLLITSTLLAGGTLFATAYALLLDPSSSRILPHGRP